MSCLLIVKRFELLSDLYEGHQGAADVSLGRRSRDAPFVRRLTGDGRVKTDQSEVRLVRDTGAVLYWLVRHTSAVLCQLSARNRYSGFVQLNQNL